MPMTVDRCYINVYCIHNSYIICLHDYYLYTFFSNIYLQYESLKILKYIVRITIYYDVIICYFMYTVFKWITAKTYKCQIPIWNSDVWSMNILLRIKY